MRKFIKLPFFFFLRSSKPLVVQFERLSLVSWYRNWSTLYLNLEQDVVGQLNCSRIAIKFCAGAHVSQSIQFIDISDYVTFPLMASSDQHNFYSSLV